MIEIENAEAVRDDCKGCRASVKATAEQIRRLVSRIKPEHCAPDELYARRLEACRSCESFAYGTTCMHCGCFVEVRAKFNERHCPHPNPAIRARWTFIESEEATTPC